MYSFMEEGEWSSVTDQKYRNSRIKSPYQYVLFVFFFFWFVYPNSLPNGMVINTVLIVKTPFLMLYYV